ncbi:SDR family NAD(P)-dependent oxidoreductase [Saccharicrinis fermentans]|uniref:3-oxoacyl-[acyl-carrier-protein] reductase FabG n=1 Tax=Saccharicrinis fermentans DSM 9555 = JCM 21142 TaxID=869213 RepID=W7YLN1_9BACT|nr:SDR family oxidoreductase [Saccharicrinis fermentans]GAF03269.1 3-oxoacyl-[acyl-carrier-protein] reductase FabG [Saccharicrinis fermentans DSM 9555 = JCM 21142]
MGNHPFTLNDKLVLVTGASSGIGRQCAITCSRLGAVVVLLGRDENRLSETMEAMHHKDRHESVQIDLCEFDRIPAMVKNLTQRLGMISGLINCAGVSTTLPLNALSVDKMNSFMETNVFSALNLTKYVVSSSNFSKEGGSVIFLSSVMGVVGAKGKTLHSMTKGALVSASKSMAVELGARKIRVNTVSPGVVETPMSKSAIYSRNKEALEFVKEQHPLGLGEPEDVANACAFLLSEGSKWITGTNMIVDGGYLAK